MVIERDARGRTLPNYCHQEGIDLKQFRKVFLEPGSTKENEFLGILKKDYPEVDKASYYVRDIWDQSVEALNALLLPRDAPDIPVYPEATGEMPDPHESYVITLWGREDTAHTKTVLAVAREPELRNIVRMHGARLLALREREISFSYELVTPEQFIVEAKRLIDAGVNLPPFIMRFGDLGEYAKQAALRKQAGQGTSGN